MTGRIRAALLAAAGAVAGCGQQGPLMLPDSARPIERLEQPATEPEAAEPGSTDDERARER